MINRSLDVLALLINGVTAINNALEETIQRLIQRRRLWIDAHVASQHLTQVRHGLSQSLGGALQSSQHCRDIACDCIARLNDAIELLGSRLIGARQSWVCHGQRSTSRNVLRISERQLSPYGVDAIASGEPTGDSLVCVGFHLRIKIGIHVLRKIREASREQLVRSGPGLAQRDAGIELEGALAIEGRQAHGRELVLQENDLGLIGAHRYGVLRILILERLQILQALQYRRALPIGSAELRRDFAGEFIS